MVFQSDKISPIFKSLQPEGSPPPPSATVHEAQQRWPLFKAVAPTKPPVPELLTEEERQNWQNVGSETPVHENKAALTVPGLGERLAEGLSVITGQAKRRSTPERPDTSPPVSAEPASPPLPEIDTRESEPPPLPPIDPPSAEPPLNSNPGTPEPSPFVIPSPSNSINSTPIANAQPGKSSESLKNLFQRLEQPQASTAKPPAKKSAFLSRLAKK